MYKINDLSMLLSLFLSVPVCSEYQSHPQGPRVFTQRRPKYRPFHLVHYVLLVHFGTHAWRPCCHLSLPSGSDHNLFQATVKIPSPTRLLQLYKGFWVGSTARARGEWGGENSGLVRGIYKKYFYLTIKSSFTLLKTS